MKKRLTKVGGVLRDDGACGFYRLRQPLAFANNLELIDAKIGGVTCEGTDLYDVLQQADVIFVPRPNDENMLKLILTYQQAGKKIVVDHDDDIFNVNPFSPHYEDYGTEEVEIMWEGKKVKLWEDGKLGRNGKIFDVEKNRQKQEIAIECVREADAVTVTTELLKKIYEPINSCVFILPNCVDFDRWKQLPLKKDKHIRIGWHGGSSHYEDWQTVVGPLKRILKKNKRAKFIACGHEFRGLVNDIPKSQYEFNSWVHMMAHPYFQAGLNIDIAILPLKKDLFNSGKSAIKWIEYSALKIPCLVADHPPYNKVVKDNVNGLLFSTTMEFKQKLQKLMDDPALRDRLAQKAFEDVSRDYDIYKNAHLWADMFDEVKSRKIIKVA